MFSFYKGFWPGAEEDTTETLPLEDSHEECEEEEDEEHDPCVDLEDEDDGIDISDEDLAIQLGARACVANPAAPTPSVNPGTSPSSKLESASAMPMPTQAAPTPAEGIQQLQAAKMFQPGNGILERGERQARIALLKYLGLLTCDKEHLAGFTSVFVNLDVRGLLAQVRQQIAERKKALQMPVVPKNAGPGLFQHAAATLCDAALKF